MPKRLKVFEAHLGFFDTVVAAPSQKAALLAWGSRQNLFGDGAASITNDPDAVQAALAKPGVVLKRLSGSREPFEESPTLPKVKAPGRTPQKLQPPARPLTKPDPPPDRSGLDAAERALFDLKRERAERRTSFDEREKA